MTLPATRALVMKHVGPYTALGNSYRLMSEVMEENGLTPTGAPREIYVTDPEEVSDPNEYETVIVWPIGPEGELKPGGLLQAPRRSRSSSGSPQRCRPVLRDDSSLCRVGYGFRQIVLPGQSVFGLLAGLTGFVLTLRLFSVLQVPGVSFGLGLRGGRIVADDGIGHRSGRRDERCYRNQENDRLANVGGAASCCPFRSCDRKTAEPARIFRLAQSFSPGALRSALRRRTGRRRRA